MHAKQKFEGKEYPIHVVGRHLEITEPMKTYAVDKLTRIERFGGRVMDVTIVMDIQKLVHTVDFIIDVNNTKIKVQGQSENMYASVDMAIAKLESKLTRYLKRLHEHHKKGINSKEMPVNVIRPVDDINDQIEEQNLREIEEQLKPHEIVSRKTRHLKTLNQHEVVMKMELSDDNFMIYRGEEDQKLKVIYRRKDGNYGIIEVE